MERKATHSKKTVKKTAHRKMGMCTCPRPCKVCKPMKKTVRKTVRKTTKRAK